jgi:hypothetical protein
VDNNPDFGFRIVSEFESTATTSGAAGYVAAASGSSYGTAGTIRLDMLMVLGEPIPPMPGPAVLLHPAISNGWFRVEVGGSAGARYVMEGASQPGGPWLREATNTAPFVFEAPLLSPHRVFRATTP